MTPDFNELVATVSRATMRAERAGELLTQAQTAHEDAVAALADAERELQRALAFEIGGVEPLRIIPPAAPASNVVALPTIAQPPPRPRHHRCSMCRRPGHRITTCPELKIAAK